MGVWYNEIMDVEVRSLKTKVRVKHKIKYMDVPIRSFSQLEMKQNTMDKWQKMLDYMAETFDVSVAFIMVITENHIKELLKSMYRRYPSRVYKSNRLLTGIFCETVIGRDELVHIKNLEDDYTWKDMTDITMNTTSYYGLPLKYPNGDFFGTICVFDRKELEPTASSISLMELSRDSIEKDLKILTLNKQIDGLSIVDPLTGLYNQNKIDEIISEYQYEIDRNVTVLSIAYIRINNFKEIKEQYGDEEIDELISLLTKIISKRSRHIDRIGRVMTNEFVIISKGSDAQGQEVLLNDLRKYSKFNLELESYNLEFAYGICEVKQNENIKEKLIEAKHLMELYVEENYSKQKQNNLN